MTKDKRAEPRSFTKEFKQNAVQLVVNECYSITAAADGGENSLRRWVKHFAPAPKECGPDATLEQLLE